MSQNLTSRPAYVQSTDRNAYKVLPLITVGDRVPLLAGNFGSFTPSQTQTFAMPGIPDGLGLFETANGDKYVYMNSEIGDGTATDIQTARGDGQINGARVSLFVFDRDWNVIGGKNAIENVNYRGLNYGLNIATGNYQDGAGNVLRTGDFNNFSRFCSGYLATFGFVNQLGQEVPVWFPGIEVASGTGLAVTPDGTATVVESLGRYAKENVLAASQYRATNSDYTVLIGTEDFRDGELYISVSRQTPENPNGFYSSLADCDKFDLFILKVVDSATGAVFGNETMSENQVFQARYTAVPDEIALGDATGLSNYANTAGNSTEFERIEDIAEDPNNPGTFYFVTTGTTDEITVDGATVRPNSTGKLYRFTLGLDANGVLQPGTIETLLVGGLGKGVSYDNLVVDGNGNIFIQEDETAGTATLMQQQGRDAGIWRYNIAANEGVVGTDKLDFIIQTNQAAEGQEFVGATGDWETSGIIRADVNALPGRSSLLFDIQAHTIDPTNGDLTPEAQQKASQILRGNYDRGGQLLLALPTEQPEPFFGTAAADSLDISIPQSPIDGTADLIFTAAGTDFIDTSTVAFSAQGDNRVDTGSGGDIALAGRGDRVFGVQGNDLIDATQGKGGNRLYGGAGNDELYVYKNDVAVGGEGNDTLDASVGEGNNRLYGGAGNDLAFLGKNDRIVGAEGDDQFYVLTGGGNTIVGGAGADQFWIANAQTPDAPNTVADLQIGTDAIGIGGLGINSTSGLSITDGNDGAIVAVANGPVLAVFQGILANNLLANPNTFVFA